MYIALVTASILDEAATESEKRGSRIVPLLFGRWSKCVGNDLQRLGHLNTAYHRSVCPALRLPAESCRFRTMLRTHSPRRKGKENARHTLTVDGRTVTMAATKVCLSPWPPLRFSVRLQGTASRVVQAYLDYSRVAGVCQVFFTRIALFPEFAHF